jgi:hypothetical protein
VLALKTAENAEILKKDRKILEKVVAVIMGCARISPSQSTTTTFQP